MKDLQIKKLYYSISEVSKLVGLEPYVLRYWETEFEQLKPQKNRAGNRVYTEKDIEIIRLIQQLTREEKYTIPGARQVMGTMNFENGVPKWPIEEPTDADDPEIVVDVPGGERWQSDLAEIRTMLIKLRNKLDGGQG